MPDLVEKNCISNPTLLVESEITSYLSGTENWILNNTGNNICKEFSFKNYYQTIAFVNAVAWIVHQQNHHPEIKISYNKCNIIFNTHSVSGLSINDFICAAKINNITVQDHS